MPQAPFQHFASIHLRAMIHLVILAGVSVLCGWYLYRLSVRLRQAPTSKVARKGAYTVHDPEELEKVSYKDIDMLRVIPPATMSGYAVIGGSGFVGRWVQDHLLVPVQDG